MDSREESVPRRWAAEGEWGPPADRTDKRESGEVDGPGKERLYRKQVRDR